jgi:hypothetical protein
MSDTLARLRGSTRLHGARGRGSGRLGEEGLTLAEILIAIAVLTIGLLGVAGALAVSTGGVTGGITGGQAAIERGFAASTAVMLAQEWVEEIKRRRYTASDDELVPTSPSAPTGFADQAFGSIPGYPNHSRQARIFADQPAANMKTVIVTVRYRYASATGTGEEGMTLGTIAARRP